LEIASWRTRQQASIRTTAADFDKTQVIQCKIEIDRTIFYCGTLTSLVTMEDERSAGVDAQHLLKDSERDYLVGKNNYITGLKANRTSNSTSTRLAGTAAIDESCFGTQYSDLYGTWDNVIQVLVRITRNFEVLIHCSTSKIIYLWNFTAELPPDSAWTPTAEIPFGSPFPEEDSCHFSHTILYTRNREQAHS